MTINKHILHKENILSIVHNTTPIQTKLGIVVKYK